MLNVPYRNEHSTPASPPPHNFDNNDEAPPSRGFRTSALAWGLHPASAGGLVAIDWMLFGGEIASFGVLVVVSFFVGCAVTVPVALIQRYAYGDNWGASIGKAMLVGLLTAIPTALPSFVTAGWGVVGAIGLRDRARGRTTIDTTGSDVN
jgi:hypothetical protein